MQLQDSVKKAREFALKAHGEQKYGEDPYSVHLDAVAEVLRRFGWKEDYYLQAGYLHDVLEDTEAKVTDVLAAFGPDVTRLVMAVTDQPGPSRKVRKAKTYPIIRGTPGAIVIKLADRIANVESAKRHGHQGLLKMYTDEQPGFEAICRTGGPVGAMWGHLRMLLYAKHGEVNFPGSTLSTAGMDSRVDPTEFEG